MVATAGPTFSAFSVTLGAKPYSASAFTDGKITITLPAKYKLEDLTVTVTASGEGKVYLSKEAGAEPYTSIAGSSSAALGATFDLYNGMPIYTTAKQVTEMTEAIANGTDASYSLTTYVLDITFDEDQDTIAELPSFTLGLGNCTVYNIIKYAYPKPVSGDTGIPLPKGGLGVISVSVKGGYSAYFDPVTSRLIVYGGDSGAETSNGTNVYATVVMLRR